MMAALFEVAGEILLQVTFVAAGFCAAYYLARRNK